MTKLRILGVSKFFMHLDGWIIAGLNCSDLSALFCTTCRGFSQIRGSSVLENFFTIVKVVECEGEVECHFLINYGEVSRRHRHIVSVCHVILVVKQSSVRRTPCP